MKNKENDFKVCPNCGAEIPMKAPACPECGADEQTGWSEQTYLDGLGLPDEEEYNELYEKEFGKPKRFVSKPWLLIGTGIVLLALALFGLLRMLL
ncbi:MAG: zinc-ribbon domain-containing protein [Chitinivibrionales bacterium]|nr:zinc-ribbon domain-containing protein [Chitinivibrionales bacterium]